MFKLCFFAAILAVALAFPAADPKPEAKPEAKPGIIATYTGPLIPSSRLVTYNAPLTYPGYFAAPIVYDGYAYRSIDLPFTI